MSDGPARRHLVTRVMAAAGALVFGVLAWLATPAEDCLEWCAMERIVFVAFALLVVWPAVAPPRWLGRGDAPLVSALVVAVLAFASSSSRQDTGGQMIPVVTAALLFTYWLLWRIGNVQRRAADARDTDRDWKA